MAKQITTWDGLPVSPEAPFGAVIVVYRRRGDNIEYLLLHRAQFDPGYVGDWAWTPPAGARLPNEPIDECAQRELSEETGLRLSVQATGYGREDWPIYRLEVLFDQEIVLDAEHDRFEWVDLATALSRCRPPRVGSSLLAVSKLLAAEDRPKG